MSAEHDARENASAQSVDVLPAVDHVLQRDFEPALSEIFREEGGELVLRAGDGGDVDQAADVVDELPQRVNPPAPLRPPASPCVPQGRWW